MGDRGMGNGMTIGELKQLALKYHPDTKVQFGEGPFAPDGSTHSYRGYYDRPAIGYGVGECSCTVGQFVSSLHKLTSTTYSGYKGGEYEYTDNHSVYVAQYSEAFCPVISGYRYVDGVVQLTLRRDDE